MIHVEVVTPHGRALDEQVDELIAPGAGGEFGVLAGHTPLIAALKAGALRWRKGAATQSIAIGAGFAEVMGDDHVVVLTERSLTPDKVDSAAAKRDLEEAELASKDLTAPTAVLNTPERNAVDAKRDWALARLAVVSN